MSRGKTKRTARDNAAHDLSLGMKCPRCGVAPNVWCGPVLDRAVFHPINPWMHEQRIRAGYQELDHG